MKDHIWSLRPELCAQQCFLNSSFAVGDIIELLGVFNCYSETSAFSGGSDMNSSPTTYQSRASLVAQLVKNLPAMQETLVQCREDPLEKGDATHSSILGLPWWLRW